MVAVKIDETLKERCPDAALGLLQAKVAVAPDPEEFLALLNGKIAELSEVELSQANKRDKIQTTRKAYKGIGEGAQPLSFLRRGNVQKNCKGTRVVLHQ